MSVIGKLGEKLKKTRESKGYSIREVSEQTHITPKYIEALEQEDYSVFPSETYVVGFLRTYSEFLGINAEEIIKEYKGLKVQISETPVEKLTEITRSKYEVDYNLLFKFLMIIVVIIAGIFIYKFSKSFLEKSSKKTLSSSILSCNEREVKDLNFHNQDSILTLMDMSGKYNIKIQDIGEIGICIAEINYQNNPKSIQMDVYYQNHTYSLEILNGESVVLSNTIPDLLQKAAQLELSIKNIEENNIHIEIVSRKKEFISQKAIVVVLEIIQDTYLEWISDGKSYQGIFLKQGETRILEADTRLDIKIGNGAGVRYRQGDFPPKIAGPSGKIVKIVFSKVPDPLDPTKFRIEEVSQVAK